MRTQNPTTNKDASSRRDVGLRELTSSMIRFSNAVTLFSMHQMQNALGAVTDSQALINPFCGALDAISNTPSTQIDAAKKSTLDKITRTGAEMVDRTMDAMYVRALNPARILDTTATSFPHKRSPKSPTNPTGSPRQARRSPSSRPGHGVRQAVLTF